MTKIQKMENRRIVDKNSVRFWLANFIYSDERMDKDIDINIFFTYSNISL